ncbi:hypothetical protein DICVIV_09889 [Dictyocaulus viviparus]|uniref:Uncharacterized protein n=1 Tax=Dictyocaulus viviparus TaxID=29172 RepID=A0A0D8XJR1_DICVI|nr:hypothetical protein DICVIV_09889 [Dictyocaulus viviparus]
MSYFQRYYLLTSLPYLDLSTTHGRPLRLISEIPYDITAPLISKNRLISIWIRKCQDITTEMMRAYAFEGFIICVRDSHFVIKARINIIFFVCIAVKATWEMEVDDMIAAINAVHDPSTSNADRLKYTQMIEGFKEGPVDLVVEKLFDIISRSSLLIQYTSWTLIEDVIRYKWNLIATNIRLDLRNRVFHAIDIQVSEETIECCARCVVAMMEHEWPQNWPELNSELLEMSERGI